MKEEDRKPEVCANVTWLDGANLQVAWPSPNCMFQGHNKSHTTFARTAEPKLSEETSRHRNTASSVVQGAKSYGGLQACNLVEPSVTTKLPA
jgi:hypothetical protein